MIILGAGLAGLLAGTQFPSATIFEASPPATQTHKALLRFRTDAVGTAVGIEFRKVRVHKGIWYDGRFSPAATIQLANWYARKVIGSLQERSIWDLETVDRYIAPEDFPAQLAARCGTRLQYSTPVTSLVDWGTPVVSTIPMNVMARMSGASDAPEFRYASIAIQRWRVPGADVFQTVYFPDPVTTLYRASLTGDMMIAEFAGTIDDAYPWEAAFGLTRAADMTPIETATQRYGKILPIEEAWRQRFIYELTTQHQVYSLGRFATWRNILMDDVLHDLGVIKRLLTTSPYNRSKFSAVPHR